MKVVWEYLLPSYANDFCGSDNRVDAGGFEDVDLPDVREWLDSHSQPLTDSDLVDLEQQPICDEKRNFV
jgi:hypothetical protein